METKHIIGYEDSYTISNNGEVISLPKLHNAANPYWTQRKILKQSEDKKGYFIISLRKNNSAIQKKVHRLVAEAFIPNPDNKPTVNHIDGNKANNNVSNLEWATRSENSRHAYNTGLLKIDLNRVRKMGKDISEKRSIKVAGYNFKTNELVFIEKSIAEACRKHKLHKSTVANVLNGKIPYHKGMYFKKLILDTI